MLNRQKADGTRRPLLLVGEMRDALWGGTCIAQELGMESCRIAELWALSVRSDVNTKIDGSGQTLGEYIRTVGGDTVAPSYRVDQPFPLLLKILDADLPLSVQVHPDDAYAQETQGENALGKCEMWYVLRADSHAEIVYGMKDGLTATDFVECVEQGKTLDGVTQKEVREGECYYIPAGLLHALGGGITVAEIQQNSDTTYRIYDYDRIDKNGQKRDLHLKDGLSVLRPYDEEALRFARYEAAKDAPDTEILVDTNRFRVRYVGENECFSDSADLCFRAVLALSDLTLESGDTHLLVPRFHAAFVPAGTGSYQVKGQALVADADCLFL